MTRPKKSAAASPDDEQPTTRPLVEPERILITRPNIREAKFELIGSTHLSINRVSEKVREDLMRAQAEGGPARSRKKRDPKDFKALWRAAQYRSVQGWCGLHAAALRCAAISACRIVGFKMTLAKLGIFTVADGYDREDGTPLIRIYGSEPHMWTAPVRNATGVFDLRSRPRWSPGQWRLRPTIRYDADMFTLTDVSNLIMRIGMQVGLCEGRPDSRDSAGLEYGLFEMGTVAKEKVDAPTTRKGRKAA